MKIHIHGKNITVTDAMRERVEKKLGFLNKYFLIDDDTNVKVVVKVYPIHQKIEVTIPTKVALLRAEAVHEDFYAAIDLVVDKLEDQIRRQKTRLNRKHKEKLAVSFIDEIDQLKAKQDDDDIEVMDEKVVRTKQVVPQLMDLDEAILQMEMLGHSFFIYTDSETKTIAVVYKRNNGGYGLLET